MVVKYKVQVQKVLGFVAPWRWSGDDEERGNNVRGRTREFLAEAEDILGVVDRDIMHLSRGLSTGQVDPGVIKRLFRSIHTLKGLSSIFEYPDITRLCHAFEDKLDMLRLGRTELDERSLETITNAQALLAAIVGSGRGDGASLDVSALIEELDETFVPKEPPEECSPFDEEVFSSLTEYENCRLRENLRAGNKVFKICTSFEIASFDKDLSALTSALEDLAEVIATLPSAGKKSGRISFEMLIATRRGREEVLQGLGDFKGLSVSNVASNSLMGKIDSRPLTMAVKNKKKRRSPAPETMRRNTGTIRVDVEKIESLMGSLDELYGLKARLARITDEIIEDGASKRHAEELQNLRSRCDEVFDRMRGCVLAVKMVRIGRLFRRFEPYIERLASECGKRIGITTYGSDTEVDMSIIEELADPLMHIIRNVIDHGIETPSERSSLGKDRVGIITLSAYQKGTKVVIEVKDDGRGIDIERVCARAVKDGYIDENEASSLAPREKLDLIFLPGLSTAEDVSSVSGRGVGLDVVRENLTLLNGVVDVETVPGKGTRFILTIPVMQTMIGALICEDGDNSFAIPGSCITEIRSLGSGDSLKDGFITIGKECLRAVRPAQLFNHESPSRNGARPAYAVVTSLGPARLCLLVEKVGKEYNMILRPLPFEDKVRGILGLAESPDGEAALVLDIPGVMEMLSIAGEGPQERGEKPAQCHIS